MPVIPLSIITQDAPFQWRDPCCVTMFKPAEPLSQVALQLFTSKVPAGFPSSANDYIEKDLDLNELMIQNPADMDRRTIERYVESYEIELRKRILQKLDSLWLNK